MFDLGRITALDALFYLVIGVSTLSLIQGLTGRYAYPTTRVDAESLGDLMTVQQCSKVASPKCCRKAEFQGMVDGDAAANCRLCEHPNCTDYTAQDGPSGNELPFQLGKYSVIRPQEA